MLIKVGRFLFIPGFLLFWFGIDYEINNIWVIIAGLFAMSVSFYVIDKTMFNHE